MRVVEKEGRLDKKKLAQEVNLPGFRRFQLRGLLWKYNV